MGTSSTSDHDFPGYTEGKIIRHRLCHVKRNVGHITLGTGRETSRFACDSFRLWWRPHGARAYPRGTSIHSSAVPRGRKQ